MGSHESQYKVFHFYHGGLDKLCDTLQQWKYCRDAPQRPGSRGPWAQHFPGCCARGLMGHDCGAGCWQALGEPQTTLLPPTSKGDRMLCAWAHGKPCFDKVGLHLHTKAPRSP